MSKLYLYKNRLWKPEYEFNYTGAVQNITIPSGEWLLYVGGAKGGCSPFIDDYKHSGLFHERGGSSYGIINLENDTTAFVYVGGDGTVDETDPVNIPGIGGFNGGGNGAKGCIYKNNTYGAGVGGGGGTDIRLNEDTLYHRVIVAGGAGGSPQYLSMSPSLMMNGFAFGGGVNGGPLVSQTFSTDTILAGNTIAGQTGPIERFGVGQDAVDKTEGLYISMSDKGASGGGGGWYGGYAIQNPDMTYASSNGGGGSGYVLTTDSAKPDGYMLTEEYYLTDTYMEAGSAEYSHAMILKEVSVYNAGDEIYVPCTSEMQSINLARGVYTFECLGGDSGNLGPQADNTIVPGGYSKGTLDLKQTAPAFIYVGGSGFASHLPHISIDPSFGKTVRPSLGFNGAGHPGLEGYRSGGGATDVRLLEDTLYNRFIVAGGAGGFGDDSSMPGGVGGGLEGAAAVGGYYYPPLTGQGTQTHSIVATGIYPETLGGFGYGGDSRPTGTYLPKMGGTGGGGWFGGGGVVGTTQTSTSYKTRGGHGGSGYVLTEDSYKPEGYRLNDPDLYLTDASTSKLSETTITQFPGQTYVKIHVDDLSNIPILCNDEEGYKYFDKVNNYWALLPSNITELTQEVFEEYGCFKFVNDTNLLDDYEILFFDEFDVVTEVELDIVPPKQKISRTIKKNMGVKSIYIDAKVNEEDCVLSAKATRNGVGSNTKITMDVFIDKLKPSVVNCDIYTVTTSSK